MLTINQYFVMYSESYFNKLQRHKIPSTLLYLLDLDGNIKSKYMMDTVGETARDQNRSIFDNLIVSMVTDVQRGISGGDKVIMNFLAANNSYARTNYRQSASATETE